jgi:hypothetical protein
MLVLTPRLPKFRRMPGRILTERLKRKPMPALSMDASGDWWMGGTETRAIALCP